MDKQAIRKTMLSLEAHELESAREEYLEYVAGARLDRSEPIEDDEQAQAKVAADLSSALDDDVHDHEVKLRTLRLVDFDPKTRIAEGAVVKLAGRYFVVAVSTGRFSCDGIDFMGISTASPLFEEMEGKATGDIVILNGRSLLIEDVS